jgi:maltose alpha-D-glucosyltransferase/alpha-amylase
VLAFLREEGDNTIPSVCNVSRAAPAVDFDLSALSGQVPMEMLGGTPSPRTGG